MAVASVEAAESACLAHIKAEGELSVVDQTLQDKVARAALEAAAVDGFSAQVTPTKAATNL